MKQPKVPKYPFRRVGSADKPSEKTLKSLACKEITSGQGKPKLRLSKRSLDRERKLAVVEKSVHGMRPPKWLLARIAKHAPVRVVMDDVFRRLRRTPSENNLRFTQRALNELGRRRGGGKLLRQTVTQKLVDEFQAKGGK